MANKLQSDGQLRDLIDAYLELYRQSFGATYEDANLDLESGGFKLTRLGYVRLDQALHEAQDRVVKRSCTLLGPQKAHESSIEKIIDSSALSMLENSLTIADARNSAIDNIWTAATTNFQFLLPNYLIRFAPDVQEIEIGPVKALLTENAINHVKLPKDLQLLVGPKWKMILGPGKFTIELPPTCWIIRIETDQENVSNEADWTVDVAISFLRIHRPTWKPLMSRPGGMEAAPTQPNSIDKIGVAFSDKGVSAGGSSLPGYYNIDREFADVTATPKFRTGAELVFAAQKNTLAQRVNQALGWMTRGRRSADQSERLLYFFTAIEALLSTNDKSAPVSQTIARHAAVLLTDNNEERGEIAAELKTLYDLRSKLVHAGSRTARTSHARNIELLAENLVATVVHLADLSQTHDNFCGELAKSSYGLPWDAAKLSPDTTTPPTPAAV